MSSLNQVGRWLGAFAVVGVLSIDAIEQEGYMRLTPEQLRYAREALVYRAPETLSDSERAMLDSAFPRAVAPTGVSTAEWSEYNARANRTLAELSRLPRPRCECGTCEGCQRRHSEARQAVNDALARAIREDL